MRIINGILIVALIVAFTPIAAAQEPQDKVAEEKPERGPVTITPTFAEKDGKFLLTKGDIVTPTGQMELKAEETKVKPGE